jgi:hypothetical protein
MSTDHDTPQIALPAPWWLKSAGCLFTAAMAAILLVNAATTSIWEDESNGYFLSKRPLGEMLGLMADNVHEDPPLYDVVMNGWIRVTGHNLPALRSLSIACWLLMLPGLFLSARRLAGERAAWAAIAVAGLLPLDWLLPVSMRWYSLFTCLCIWNFYSLLRILDVGEDACPEPAASQRRLVRTLPYWLTGAALWYTNYSAPVIFFSHLLIVLFRKAPKRRVLVDLVVSWLMIGLCYAPWLPTFLRQLGASSHGFSLTRTGMAVWVLLAGEFSTPLSPGMATAVAALAIALAVLVLAQLRRCWIPLVVVVVVLLAMSLTGVIWTKRVLFLSPLVAMTIALAVCRSESPPRWLLGGRVCLVALLLLVSGLSFAQMVRRTDWLSYRWLDPCREALDRVRETSPGALLVTNSNPVLFYLDDPYGKAARDTAAIAPEDFRPTAVYYSLDDSMMARYEPFLSQARRAAYIYHSAYTGPISGGYEDLVRQMQAYGFRPVKMEGLLEMPAAFVRRHPRFQGSPPSALDAKRIVIVYFEKPTVAETADPPGSYPVLRPADCPGHFECPGQYEKSPSLSVAAN